MPGTARNRTAVTIFAAALLAVLAPAAGATRAAGPAGATGARTHQQISQHIVITADGTATPVGGSGASGGGSGGDGHGRDATPSGPCHACGGF